MRIPVVTSSAVEPDARGRDFGARWRTRIESGLDRYLRLFHAVGVEEPAAGRFGAEALGELTRWSPELATELAGIAAGAGMEPRLLGAVNARTEVLAAARRRSGAECSTAVVLGGPGEAPRTIQTWDWNETLRDAPVGWAYRLASGRRVRGLTEFGILGKIGVNDAGLGLHLNILRHGSDHDRIGVPVHAVARRILDEASTIDEATEIARSARLSASTVLTVVTYDGSHGAVRGLELSPAGVGLADPVDDALYVHTNHFLDAALAPGERLGTERPNTYERFTALCARPAGLGSPDLADRVEAMRLHAEDGAPVCCHASVSDPLELRSETLATVSLDVGRGRMWVHRGGPCRVRPETWQLV